MAINTLIQQTNCQEQIWTRIARSEAVHTRMVCITKIILCGAAIVLCGLLSSCSSNTTAPVSNVWDQIHTTQTRYTVQPGDTLYTIAWRFNLTDESLASWNHLSKPYALQVGQTLRVTAPDAETATPVTEPAPAPQKIAAAPNFTPTQSSTAQSVPTSQHKTTETKSVGNEATHSATTNQADKTTTPVVPVATDAQGTGNWPWPAKGKVLERYGQNGNKGLDLSLPMGSKIKAVQPGTVVYAGANLHDYGQLLIIKQKDDLITAYAHNSKLLVNEGAQVATGQVIALSGDSESSAPMLHFEVRQLGKTVDPLQYLAAS